MISLMQKHRWAYLMFFPVCAFVLVVAQQSLVTFVQVRGDSMNPTLYEGQVIAVNRVAFGFRWPIVEDSRVFWNPPQPGDLVVVQRTDPPALLVKRVAASAGQTLVVKDHTLLTGSFRIPLSAAQEYWLSGCDTVPSGALFVVGDNPDDSRDSRDWGFVLLGEVVGTPWL